MDLPLWRDIAIIVLAVLGLFFLLGLSVVLYALFVFTRKTRHQVGQALQNLGEITRKVEEGTRKTTEAVIRPMAEVSAFQAGTLAFFRSLFSRTPKKKDPP